ncbi:MAG: hypothetical protein ACM65L_07055 [Microcoleus sp.]
MTKTPPQIKIDANQTSSAATNYGGADQGWLKKIKGTVDWLKIPSVDPGAALDSIKGFLLKNLKGDLIKEIGSAIMGNFKELFGKIKRNVSNRIGSIVTVGKKILGTLTNTAEGQGLALFGAISAAAIGGGILLGAGPEVVTGMLRMSQLAYTFNFNQTDEQIDKQIEGSITALYATAGETLGSGLASFLSGGVFRIPRVQINLTKVSILWRAINEEAQTQMLQQLKNLARTAFFGGLKMLAKVFYRDSRKWLKALAKSNPDHPLIKLIPGGAKTLEKWGEKGIPPWSMALFNQVKFEKLQQNPLTKDIGVFLENFAEGFGEGIQEFLPDLVRQPTT